MIRKLAGIFDRDNPQRQPAGVTLLQQCQPPDIYSLAWHEKLRMPFNGQSK